MSKKMTMLALALVSAAMFALPAVASANEWEAHNATGKTFTITQVSANAKLESANGSIITCTAFHGNGEYTSTKTGTMSLHFTGCTENTFGLQCKSEGAPVNGTIAVNNKVFHNVIIGNAGDSNTPIGVLITVSDVKLICSFLTVTVTGDVIGEIEPATPPATNCGVAGTTYRIDFAPKGTGTPNTFTQKYEQITTTGTIYDLRADFGPDEYTASQTATGQIHLSGPVTPTCT